jgi:hypothetical protein
VEFRLLYKGALPPQSSGGGNLVEKHQIRRQLHCQLKELWRHHQILQRMMDDIPGMPDPVTGPRTGKRWEFLASDYTKYGYRFLPLVNKKWGLGCSLDIVFLRRDSPGQIIIDGGDLDNRMKTLFDGLRIPQYNQEAEKFPPQDGEEPFYCLLEDDRLITDVSVTTDRLLLPMDDDEQLKDVHLLLHVRTKILDRESAHSTYGAMI